jgi:hypothetical protein
MLNKNLFVRVKRNREDDPADNLCIVEDVQPSKKRSIKTLETQLAGLNAASAPATQPKRLILSRVRTLECADDALLSSSTFEHERGALADEPPRKKRVAARIIVTSGSKTLQSETSPACVIIDMAQMMGKPAVAAVPAPAPAPSVTPLKAPTSRILDPATRTLERGILTAVKNGDFNDVSAALMQGANVDHQTAPGSDGKVGGYTALMAATLHCNIRMVRRLVTKGVDVGRQNSEGKTALDLLVVTPRNKSDGAEIRTLLQNALVRAAQSPVRAPPSALESLRSKLGSKEKEEEGDFVYDIYCVDTSAAVQSASPEKRAAPSDDAAPQEREVGESATEGLMDTEDSSPYSVVRVEGLRILDSDHIELMMAYDSDWSDLGDDEDPDSNDERFHGNDYPEDEENEGYELQDSDEEKVQPRSRKTNRLGLPGGVKVGSFLPGTAVGAAAVGRGASGSCAGGARVHFSTGAEGEDVDLQDLIDQEEDAERAERRAEETPSDSNSEDSDRDEEAALYRELDGGYAMDAEDEEIGAGDGEMAENSDYDLDADDEMREELERASARLKSTRTAGGGSKTAGRRMGKTKPCTAGASAGVAALTSAEHLLYDDDENLPDFERRFGIGKVLRPQVVLDSHVDDENFFSQAGLYQEPHNTESLQELWGEVEGNREEYGHAGGGTGVAGDGAQEHADRLQHMRARTGMVFAASAREFDAHTGLAKYGAELSDEDEGLLEGAVGYSVVQDNVRNVSTVGVDEVQDGVTRVGRSLLQYRDSRPPPDTVAYDSELDGSD